MVEFTDDVLLTNYHNLSVTTFLTSSSKSKVEIRSSSRRGILLQLVGDGTRGGRDEGRDRERSMVSRLRLLYLPSTDVGVMQWDNLSVIDVGTPEDQS